MLSSTLPRVQSVAHLLPQANTNCLKIIVRKPLLLLLVPLNVLHLVLLLLQPLALAQEHEEPLLDTDRLLTHLTKVKRQYTQ